MEENIVNKNIAVILKKKGCSARMAAKQIGISGAVMSNIVRCKRKVYADEVIPIATALQVSIEDLFKEGMKGGT